MTDLKKWFPFKFKRKQSSGSGEGQKAADQPQSQAPARASQSSMAPGWLFPTFSPEMGRLMERFSEPFSMRPFAPMFGDVDRFFGDFAPNAFSPNIDIVDRGTHLEVAAELPGLDKDDIEISVQDDTLMLSGHKKHEETKEEDGCYRTERYFGSFQRAIPLPLDVDLEKAEAKFDKGVLTVRFPKTQPTPEPEQRRRIPVS